jgi:RHS repeat-associated protein
MVVTVQGVLTPAGAQSTSTSAQQPGPGAATSATATPSSGSALGAAPNAPGGSGNGGGNTPSPIVTNPTAAVLTNATTYALTGTARAASLVQVYLDANRNGRVDKSEATPVGSQQLAAGATTFSVGVPLAANSASAFLITATSGKQESKPSLVPVITQDSTPPVAPNNLTAKADPAGAAVDLAWTPSTSTDVASQRVLRASTTGGPYIQITSFADNTTKTFTDTVLTNGTAYFYVVRAVDKASNVSGNSNEASATPASVDTTAPTVSVTTPTANAITNSRTLTASASDNPGGSGVAAVQFQLSSNGGTSWTNAGNAVTAAPYTTTLPNTQADGAYQVRAQAADNAGNQATSSAVSFTLDTTPPTISVTSPTAGAITSSKTFTALSDDGAGSGIASVQFQTSRDNGATWTNAGAALTSTPYSVTVSSLVDGSYQVRAIAIDRATNSTTSASVSFTFDSTAPATPVVTAPSGPVTVNASTYTIAGIADANSLVSVWIDTNANGQKDAGDTLANSQQLSGGATSFAISVTLTPNSVNAFLVTATDSAGNVSAAVVVPGITQSSQPVGTPTCPGVLQGTVNGSLVAQCYIIASDVTIQAGTTLVVPAGAITKSSGPTIHVLGTLQVQGTAQAPVVLTSLRDDTVAGDDNLDGPSTGAAGDWGGIQVGSGGLLLADHATIRFAGLPGSGLSGQGIYLSGAKPSTISNSILNDNGAYGIYNAFASSTSGGTLTVVASRIYGHTSYGVFNGDTNYPTQAVNNWWGSNSGPKPYRYASGDAVNDTTCTDSSGSQFLCNFMVRADPWTGKETSPGGQLGTQGTLGADQAKASEPVNTANGNYTYSRTDLSIPTRGLPLAFTRTYNSLSPQLGPLGWGWTHTWNTHLTVSPIDQSASVAFGDAHTESWKWDATAQVYVAGPGVYGKLTRAADGTWDLLEKDLTHDHFAADGRLLSVADRNANITTVSYDASGLLTSVAEPAGRTLTFQYTTLAAGPVITQVNDTAGGRSIVFAYSSFTDLISVTDATSVVTTMAYDFGGHHLQSITDANQHAFVSNTYDVQSRVTRQLDALQNQTTFSYDDVALKTLVTDPRASTTTYVYDSGARLGRETDAQTQSISYGYDANNNRTQVTNKRGFVTKYGYDGQGNVTSIVDALNGQSTYVFDTQNNLKSETDARNNTTTYSYDPQGNRINRTDALNEQTQWSYDSNGQVQSQTDPNGHVTHFAHDLNGDLSSRTDALTNTTQFTYDPVGRKLSQTDANGHTTSYTYDADDRLLTATDANGGVTRYTYDVVGNRTAVQDANQHTTRYTFDTKDRLKTVVDALGGTTTYAYDANNNLISFVDPLTRTTQYTYDSLNRRIGVTDPLRLLTSYQYDANGNRTQVTDANGHATQYTYDALDRLHTVVDAMNGTTTYDYDAVGNRMSVMDANLNTTTYGYDAVNRLNISSDPLSNTTSYTYDFAGNPSSQTKPDSTVIHYGFDADNRPSGISAPGLSIGFGYDPMGNRSTLTDATGSTSYQYDALNRPTQIIQPGNKAVGYNYDAVGNRTLLVYPGGQQVQYGYDALNRLITVKDWTGATTSYGYDAGSQLLQTTNPNSTAAAYNYDLDGRATTINHTGPGSSAILNLQYTYDKVGNRLSEQGSQGTSSYGYDALDRLNAVTYPNSEQVSYAYDATGNRLALNSTVAGNTSYSYDKAGRIATAGGTTFNFDANGRQTAKTAGASTTTYSFDALDHLLQVNTTGGLMTTFTYNGDGVRVAKSTTGGGTSSYVQDLAATLPVVLMETTAGQDTLYLHGKSVIAQFQPDGSRRTYHLDSQGTTRVLSGATGAVVGSYTYDAFGLMRSQNGSATAGLTFTGEQTDGETSLEFLRARYYDFALGAFISQDPLYNTIQAPGRTTRYSYAESNPVNRVDPTGRFVSLIPYVSSICNALEGGPSAPPAGIKRLPENAPDLLRDGGLKIGAERGLIMWKGAITGDLWGKEDFECGQNFVSYTQFWAQLLLPTVGYAWQLFSHEVHDLPQDMPNPFTGPGNIFQLGKGLSVTIGQGLKSTWDDALQALRSSFS